MLDVIEQLERYADVVVETVEPTRPTDVGPVAIVATSMPRRPLWQSVLAAAAAVALVVGGFWFLVNRSNASPPAGTSSTSTDAQTNAPRSGVELLDSGPLAPRDGSALAWTGTELVVWGGAIEPVNRGLVGPDRQFADGAAYNPSTRTWRTMAGSPLPADYTRPFAVSTPDGVVIARDANVARWNPSSNTWTQLDDAPNVVNDLTLVDPSVVVSISANATLDPAIGAWSPLPAPPLTLQRPVAAWNGTELIVVGQSASSTSSASALALNPKTRTWRKLTDPPRLNATALTADRNGDQAVFADYEMNVAAYRGNAWEPLPPIPARAADYTPELDAVTPALIVSTADAVVVRTNDLWTPLPKGQLDFWGSGAVVATNGAGRDHPSVFVFGMTPTGENRLARVAPAQLASEARTLQVGEMTVRIPPGMKLVHSDSTTGLDAHATVLITLSTPTGNCDVTSTDDGGVGGPEHPWTASASGTTWSARATSSNAVRVVCGTSPAEAKQIVDATSVPVAPPGG